MTKLLALVSAVLYGIADFFDGLIHGECKPRPFQEVPEGRIELPTKGL
jgi:hypothetical protein